MQVRFSLYGSRPPANDSLWAIAKFPQTRSLQQSHSWPSHAGWKPISRKRQSAQYSLRPRLPNLFRVIRANMGCKLLVPPQLEVAHHFIERCAGGGSKRFEPPVTFGATKTPKMLFLNPYQLSAQSASVAACQRVPAFCQETKCFGSPLTAPLAAAPPHCSRKPSPSSSVEEDAQKRWTKVYMRHF